MIKKMSCKKVSRMISLRLDGEYSKEQEVIISAHLQGCPSCREKSAALEDLYQWLTPSPELEPNPQLLPHLLQHIKEQSAKSMVWFPWEIRLRPALQSLLIILLMLGAILGGFYLGSSLGGSPQVEQIILAQDFNHNLNLNSMADSPNGSFSAAYISMLAGDKK